MVWENLTGFQRDVLSAMHKQEQPHGLGIRKELHENGDYVDINHSRLYPSLDDLVEMELVEKSEADGRTNIYELTEKGEEVYYSYREWY